MKRTWFAVPVLLVGCWLLSSWLLPAIAFAEPIPALSKVPDGLSPEVQTKLSRERELLDKELQTFLEAAAAFNAKDAKDQSDAEYEKLDAWRTQYIKSAKAFNEEMTKAASSLKVPNNQTNSAPKPEVDLLGPEGRRVIKGMNDLAKRLGWSLDKQARLDKALNSLGIDPAKWSDSEQIRRTWKDVLIRGQDADLVQEASQGGGLGFPGAGKQTYAQDCAVFALANAAGLPYGVVAARAAELIRQGEWCSAGERANPQKVIEQKGLIGGEVVMLAEAFGQAEVVPSSDFAKTLQEGRPVLVGVVPKGGDARFGHAVVLTKTFQHGGETWYVMMDSNQGPQQRMFLSAKELNTLLKENGVAFRPEPGTTTKLLRDGGDQ
jgi:hypothetical protein